MQPEEQYVELLVEVLYEQYIQLQITLICYVFPWLSVEDAKQFILERKK